MTRNSKPERDSVFSGIKTSIKKLIPHEVVNYLYHLPLALLAVVYYRFPARKMTVIAITGTSGKTTVTSIVYHLLKSAGYPVSMISTVKAVIGDKEYDTGFHVTNPDSWQLQKYFSEAQKAGSQYFILEVTSHGLAQFRNVGANIGIGVVTNVTHEHLDYHHTFSRYLAAKAKIFSGVRYSVINKDDKNFRELKNKSSGRVVSFGLKNDADYTPKKFPFSTNLPGEFNKYNCLAAISVAKILEIDDQMIRKFLKNIPSIPGRMEEIETSKNYRIFLDFAHKPDALEKVIEAALKKPHNRIIVMFGAAGLRDHTKRPVMGEIVGRLADVSVVTAEDPRTESLQSIINSIITGIKKAGVAEVKEQDVDKIALYTKDGSHVFLQIPDRRKAINIILKNIATKNDIVLFCGKGHEKSMCFGTTEYPWDEKQEILEALKRRHAKK